MLMADVDEERVGVGGVGLLMRSGAVVRGGCGIGDEGDGGTLNRALAGESASGVVKYNSLCPLLFQFEWSLRETRSVGVTSCIDETYTRK